MIRTFRYVIYDDIPDYLALGWITWPRDWCWDYHDLWGVSRWNGFCDCELAEPQR